MSDSNADVFMDGYEAGVTGEDPDFSGDESQSEVYMDGYEVGEEERLVIDRSNSSNT
jgi:hypothetical protein